MADGQLQARDGRHAGFVIAKVELRQIPSRVVQKEEGERD
jgi:hypothetical protein